MAEIIISTATLTAAEGSTITSDAAGDELGRVVASAGDVNGDGYEDIIMGAIGNDRGGDLAGAAFVLFGKAGGIGSIDLTNMTAADGFRILGAQNLDLLYGVAGAGDVNGDGYDDVIVGASGNDAGGNSAGASYVIFGQAGSTRADIDLQFLTASNGFSLQGDLLDDRSGRAVSGAGDINGDGIDDFIVGAPYADGDQSLSGKAYIVYGKAGATRANIDFSSFAASDGFVIQGSGVAIVGTAVARAGDVNGDGIDDLIVGAYRTSGGGAAYVIYGKTEATRSNINVSTLAAADGFAIFGDSGGDQFGITVAGVGDVNNDGIDDVAVGANRSADRGSNTGEAYVIYGKAGSTRGALDVTGIAEDDGFLIIGNAGDQTGRAVAAAGDVNNDGIDDFIVGAIDRDPNGVGNAGATIVIYGKDGNRGTIDLANPIGGDGFTVIGTAAYDRSGTSVAGVGDLNDDGFDDILIGAPSSDNGGDGSGIAYIIYGFGTNTAPVAADDTFSLNEDGSADLAVLANDDDAEDDALTVTITDAPDHGTATVNDDGTVTYTPDANYSGTDSFKYTASDGSLTSNEATASITVAEVNDAPVYSATGGAFELNRGGRGSPPVDLFSNVSVDTVEDGQTITSVVITVENRLQTAETLYVYGLFSGVPFLGINLASDSPQYSNLITQVTGSTTTITITGAFTEAQVASAIDDLRYTNNQASSSTGGGTRTFTITAMTDSGGTDNGGVDKGSYSVVSTVLVNSLPKLEANTGLVVDEGGSVVITAAQLSYSDNEQAADAITYSFGGAVNGSVRLDGNALAIGGTFTQADINAGRVSFLHDGSESTGVIFAFSLSDGKTSLSGFGVAVTVNPVNDAPAITSNGGGASATIDFAENDTGLVTTVTSSDVDGPAPTYSLSGVDAALFDIDASTGALSFKDAPDFEAPGDAGSDNVYNVTVTASDGDLADTQDLAITVTDLIEVVPIVNQAGTRFADNLLGTPGASDFIAGNKGDDTIDGGDQNDQLFGNQGKDLLLGGSGDDKLMGGQQNDELHGGTGLDRLSGDQGNDDLYGDSGADTFVFGKKFGVDTIFDFEDGADKIEFAKKVFADFAAVSAAMSQDGADVLIADGNGNTVRIIDTLVTEIDAGDFLFV